MAQWEVNYEGWVIVEAKSFEEACNIGQGMLSNATNAEDALINDGQTGEWYLGEVNETEEEED